MYLPSSDKIIVSIGPLYILPSKSFSLGESGIVHISSKTAPQLTF